MNKQLIWVTGGIIAVLLLFFLGSTTTPRKVKATQESKPSATAASFIDSAIIKGRARLTPAQAIYVAELENGISRGDVHTQQITAYNSLANFWRDSVSDPQLSAYYISEAAKLENSEKSLTFAARLFLDNLRGEHDPAKLAWQTSQAIDLFERAIKLNPSNEDLRIGLGSSYVYGNGQSGDPQRTMKGIQELLGVVQRDSNNMKAQMVLAVGGVVSGQYDKAIARLHKVVEREPANFEAIAFLADAYAAKGARVEAIEWYMKLKRLLANPEYEKEIDNRIRMLR